jgi:glycerol-1-phosphate dehydrogenase [NAD(P)+]
MKIIPNLPITRLMPCAEIEEQRPTLLVTSAPAWEAVKGQLRGLNISTKIEVTEATIEHWNSLMSTVHGQSSVVYAIGGGLVADSAKYLAHKLNLPLTMLPSALSVDAFITAASGIRRNGCVYYIETKVPENLILDLGIIAKAPASLRAAGICDLLSIATGCWDWEFAHEHGQNPPGMELVPWALDNALSILRGTLDCAEAAGEGDPAGLKQLYDCLCMEVQLCNNLGHSRPEEGSEHYFAYCAENFTGHGWPHGDLVGPGILTMARLQDQDSGELENALRLCHIPLDRIPAEITAQTLKSLPSYCKKHGLAFGLAHTL